MQQNNSVSSNYQEHLHLLQERNKLYQQLREKGNQQQSKLKERENSFTIYTNGANLDEWSSPCSHYVKSLQYLYESLSLESIKNYLQHYESQFNNYQSQHRRAWKPNNYRIMTETGSTVTVDFQEHDLSSSSDIFSDIADTECTKDNAFNGKETSNNEMCNQSCDHFQVTESTTKECEFSLPSTSEWMPEYSKKKPVSEASIDKPSITSEYFTQHGIPRCKKAWVTDNLSIEPSFENKLKLVSSKKLFSMKQDSLTLDGKLNSSNELYVVDETEEQPQSDTQILNEALLNKIVSHIITMDSRKQQILLKALGIIENSADEGDASHELLSLKEYSQRGELSQSSTLSVKEKHQLMFGDNNSQESNLKASNSSSPISSHPFTTVSIKFELLSNWGHPSRIGLTEIEFLNALGDKLEANVTGTNMNEVVGELSNLLNGKTKVTSENEMWSCALPDNSFIFLLFTIHLPPVVSASKHVNNCYVSAIRIWNYNKTSQELDIGVQRAKIIFGEITAFDGEFQQGCGNNEDDYSQIIFLDPMLQSLSRGYLHKSELSLNSSENLYPLRKSTKDTSQCSGYNLSEKIVKDNSGSDSDRRYFRDPSDEATSLVEWLNSTSPNTQVQVLSFQQSDGIDLFDNLQRERSVSSSCLEEGKETIHNIKRPMSESADRKPKWYKDLRQKQSIPKSRSNSVEKPMWLSSPKEESPDIIQNDYGRNSSGSSRRSSSETISFLEYPINDPESSLLVFDDVRQSREPSARFGRRAPKSAHTGSVNRKTSREQQNMVTSPNDNSQLEDYWLSLHVFEQSHKGRLSMSVDTEGDILDMYMKEEKLKRQQLSSDQPVNIPRYSETDIVQLIDLDFIIPELPEGQHLTINIFTTWGDKHYVGLNGIEVFCDTGHLAEVDKIWADPADINILPEYSCDPRVVSNLIDSVYRTHDDMHLWLAPFTPNSNHYIYMTFKQSIKVAMIRIWNYNKSRIHSYRGARHMEMSLDSQPIFKGEIARACGEIQGSTEAFGDTILFTTDEDILEAISHHDTAFNDSVVVTTLDVNLTIDRPCTADHGSGDERPFTAASSSSSASEQRSPEITSCAQVEKKAYSCSCILFTLLSGWGDYQMVGLTGIELIGSIGIETVIISPNMILLPTNEQCEKLARIVDGINITTNEEHMYLFEYKDDQLPSFLIKFDQSLLISGFRIWNYNKNADDVYKGVKYISVSLDGCCISPPEGYLIRKGPGNCHFDFAQEIRFGNVSLTDFADPVNASSPRPGKNGDDSILPDYESPVMPHGFIFQLQLLSTWGDGYYVGLNGIEIYDSYGRKIPLTENNIAAYPDSVNILKTVNNDIRTPDKLIDGVNDTLDGRHMWLAPVLPGVLNRVYIIFDYPVTVSMIKLWNYAKTPTRGVKEFGLLVDDLLVYNGVLAQIVPGLESVPYHTILFTMERDIINKEKNTIIRNQDIDNAVQLTNKTELHTKGSATSADQALRPTTGVGPINRHLHRKKR